MYSRSYYPEDNQLPTLPDNYDGIAFADQMDGIMTDNEPTSAQSQAREETVPTSGGLSFLSGILGKGGLFGFEGIKMPKIGTEEILIIATAVFLLFSKNGDRECALILLFLLFIN